MQDLGALPGGGTSEAYDINDAGQIVGASSTDSGVQHAFLYTNGGMKDLGTLGGRSSVARGINRRGQVVGAAETANGAEHAFLYERGVMRDLGTLGGKDSQAYAINTAGEVVGQARTRQGVLHAFLRRGDALQDLNSLIPARYGWVLTLAASISDAGQIVGVGRVRGHHRAFLLSPSEPKRGTVRPPHGRPQQ
jgi:probable HAF family extracellular repeat protein